MNHSLKNVLKWWPTAIVLSAVIYLTLWPQPVDTGGMTFFEGADKIVHALMMGVLSAAAMCDYKRTMTARGQKLPRRAVMVICLAVAVFSAADEWAQGAMGLGRTSDIYDLLADWCGVLLSALTVPSIINTISARRCGHRP